MGQNEKITSGTKNYSGYMASVLAHRKKTSLTNKKKILRKNLRERKKAKGSVQKHPNRSKDVHAEVT